MSRGAHHLKLSGYQGVAGRSSAVLAVAHEDFYVSPEEALMQIKDQTVGRGAATLSRHVVLQCGYEEAPA